MGKIVALGGGRYDNGEMTSVAEHIVSLSGKKIPTFSLFRLRDTTISAGTTLLWIILRRADAIILIYCI